MKIGPAITKLRAIKMLSQEELADKSGLLLIDIIELEAGEMEPTKEIIKKICVGLDIEPPVLLFEALEESDVERKDVFNALQKPVSDFIAESIRPTGIELMAREREEHVTKHGRTVEHDVNNNNDGQLRGAASLLIEEILTDYAYPTDWNRDLWRKMAQKTYRERLIIAGSLLAAEYDRLTALED